VEKPSRIATGKCVLRLIMNLIPSNAVLRTFHGAVSNLPHITAWMSTIILEGEELRVWQSDMQNAFYLFKIPSAWSPMLSFNLLASGQEIGLGGEEQYALGCSVLPMGWSSSVAIMQEASERILALGRLPADEQLLRGRAVPLWMVGLLDEARKKGKAWWHVYLDNFAAGEVGKQGEQFSSGHELHQLAEKAWAVSGVVSSEKKRKAAELEAQELGGFMDGGAKTLGGSPERLLKLVQATIILLKQPHLSKKLTQVVVSLLEHTWKFTASKRFEASLITKVKKELFACCCSVPFLHAYLGAQVWPVITASDASNSGGAVGLSKELTSEGRDFVGAASLGDGTQQANILVVSLFNGIGGAIRCYDVLGVLPRHVVACDIHGPANRVTAKRWPSTEIIEDVRSIDQNTVDGWFRKVVPLEELHLWAGFPCMDLSSAKAGREGLAGKASGLFWEVVRLIKLIKKRAPAHVVVKYVAENVASMAKQECEVITKELGVFPYWLNSADAVPMNRPRLCWTSEEVEGQLRGLRFRDQEHWTEVTAEAPYPELGAWLTPGCQWPGEEEGAVFPTAMKAIPRKRPPVQPAGISRCGDDTIGRWTADGYRFPPYHYLPQYVIWRGERWRLTNSSERELLLGYGFGHTKRCMSASDIKRSKQAYEDERLSLLGDSFSIYSFVIIAAALCARYLPSLHYVDLTRRMGMAPGFRAPIRWKIPLCRCLGYGFPGDSKGTVAALNKVLLSKVNHTGSDIRITTGEVLNPRSVPRQSVEAAWWKWEPLFKVQWTRKEHINVLELRSILLAIQFQISHLDVSHLRIFHVTDSFVAMSIVAKGRTGSLQLARVLKVLNAHLLGFGLALALEHVESTENPTDGESRSLALLH